MQPEVIMIFMSTSFSRKKLSLLRLFFKAERDRYKPGEKFKAGYYLIRKDEDGSSELIDISVEDWDAKTRVENFLQPVGGL